MESETTIEDILGKDKYINIDLQIKAKELKVIGYSKMNKQNLIESILSASNKPITIIQNKKNKKKTIPKTLKNNVWDKYIGKEKGTGECNCCFAEIDSKHFECGHIISEMRGGEISIENLRPLCSLCNKSMGVQDMNEFIKKVQKENPTEIIRKKLKEYKFVDIQPTITWKKNEKSMYSRVSSYQPYLSNNNTEFNGYGSYAENVNAMLGNRGFGSFTSQSNIETLISNMDYNNISINKLTKLWCSTESFNDIGKEYNLDKYDINKCILHKPEKNQDKKIEEPDPSFILADIFILSEFIKLKI